MVTLAEDLYLLACDEATGRPRIPAHHLHLGLGGALLFDLVLRRRVSVVDDHMTAVDRTPVGDPLLDDALHALAGDTRVHEPEYWIRRLAHGARGPVEHRLVAAGVLAADDHRVLGVIPVHHTHRVNDRIEHDLERRLHAAVVVGRPASPEVVALVSLVVGVGLDSYLFPLSDRRAVARRMAEIAGDERIGPAVAHAIAADDAALGIAP